MAIGHKDIYLLLALLSLGKRDSAACADQKTNTGTNGDQRLCLKMKHWPSVKDGEYRQLLSLPAKFILMIVGTRR